MAIGMIEGGVILDFDDEYLMYPFGVDRTFSGEPGPTSSVDEIKYGSNSTEQQKPKDPKLIKIKR